MSKRVTQKHVAAVIADGRKVLRFISKGVADYIVPDDYEEKLRAMIDVLVAAKPLFPKK